MIRKASFQLDAVPLAIAQQTIVKLTMGASTVSEESLREAVEATQENQKSLKDFSLGFFCIKPLQLKFFDRCLSSRNFFFINFFCMGLCYMLLFYISFVSSTAFGQEQAPQAPVNIPPAVLEQGLQQEQQQPDAPSKALGRFNTNKGTVKVKEKFLDRYQSSVVRVIALDETGNEINHAMGVSVGESSAGTKIGKSAYIATSLSLILGNTLQWADQLRIVQNTGTTYKADVALIDEQLDLVLLKSDNTPTPLRFVPARNERGQINIFTIGFERSQEKDITPQIHPGILAAINTQMGTLGVTGKQITNAQTGTGIINMQGELMGMLLPNGQGVLSSALRRAVLRAERTTPFPPTLVGVVMGRGVLVSKTIPGGYKTIQAALDAIKAGKAPRPDPKRYFRAYTNDLRPAKARRPVLRVSSGTYKIDKPIELPSNISFTGSGPENTIILGKDPMKPVFTITNKKRVSISNFRIVPAALQKAKTATVEINESSGIVVLGNIIESKGGTALRFYNSKKSASFGNSFPQGSGKALYCADSKITVQTNAFLGKWPQALSVAKACSVKASYNLFVENKIGVAVSGKSAKLEFFKNTLVQNIAGVRFFGNLPTIRLEDNLFFSNVYSLYTNIPFNVGNIGRNGMWKSIPMANGRKIKGLDIIRSRPIFRSPENYDFQILPGNPNVGAGIPDKEGNPTNIGAFQPKIFLGNYTQQLIQTLETATGQKGLAKIWGYRRFK